MARCHKLANRGLRFPSSTDRETVDSVSVRSCYFMSSIHSRVRDEIGLCESHHSFPPSVSFYMRANFSRRLFGTVWFEHSDSGNTIRPGRHWLAASWTCPWLDPFSGSVCLRALVLTPLALPIPTGATDNAQRPGMRQVQRRQGRRIARQGVWHLEHSIP